MQLESRAENKSGKVNQTAGQLLAGIFQSSSKLIAHRSRQEND
jgi:hypothetical protein